MIFYKGTRRRLKYNNKKCERDGIKFDSQKELDRYLELKIMEKIGLIAGLELQKDFTLIDAIPAKNEMPAQRATKYRADFYYFNKADFQWIIEDCKGYRTELYKIKKKLMRAKYGIIIREV